MVDRDLRHDYRARRARSTELDVRLSLRQAEDFLARFPLVALLEQLDALETLQDVSLRCDRAGAFETAMLRHNREIGAAKLRCDPQFSNGN